MGLRSLWQLVRNTLPRQHRGEVKSFEREVQAAGGATGRSYTGVRIVATERVVGSVGRWQSLRSDFFYRSGAVTARFVSIGRAMQQGKVLPPIDLYKLKVRRPGSQHAGARSEYYVVDGHHRVAMARKLGQDFLDANVVEYQLASDRTTTQASPPTSTDSTAEQPAPVDPGARPPAEQPCRGEG